MLSGLRPSSGAETLQKDAATEMSDPFERTGVAAAEDGRTPVNRYQARRLPYFGSIQTGGDFRPVEDLMRQRARPGRPVAQSLVDVIEVGHQIGPPGAR